MAKVLTAREHMDAWTARMSQTCSCGGKKPQGHPFCDACWQQLPEYLRGALLEHLEHHFAERILEAEAYMTKRRKAHATLVETPEHLKRVETSGYLEEVPSKERL